MRNRIIDATIEEIDESGIKFTMADLAARLAISKSTLYTHFTSKEELIGAIIDTVVTKNDCHDHAILENDMLNSAQKLRALLISHQINSLSMNNCLILATKRNYPNEWIKIQNYREKKLNIIESLIRQGIEEKYFRPVNMTILRTIIEATIQSFLEPAFLSNTNFTFKEAINQMIDIMNFGIVNMNSTERAICYTSNSNSNHPRRNAEILRKDK